MLSFSSGSRVSKKSVMAARMEVAWSISTSPVLSALPNESRRFDFASSLISKVFASVIMIFSGFLPFWESFFKSLFIEDLILEKFIRFDFIFIDVSSRCQIVLISWSVSMDLTLFIDSLES